MDLTLALILELHQQAAEWKVSCEITPSLIIVGDFRYGYSHMRLDEALPRAIRIAERWHTYVRLGADPSKSYGG